MGLAIDTVGFTRTAGGGGADAAFTASVVSPGDTFTVRNFDQSRRAHLINVIGMFSTAGAQYRVRSPLFHDNVQGIRIIPGETPARVTLPREADQMLRPQDTLIVEQISNAANEVCAGGLVNYYEDLPGVAARLHSWGDISGIIKNIKPLLVVVTPNGTAGTWQDNVLTTTEDLLKANQDYAVLGYTVDNPACLVGIKGPDTGNLRICGPGDVRTFLTQQYFVELSDYHHLPMIPVINSANKGATFASVQSRLTATAINVQLILAELAQNLPN